MKFFTVFAAALVLLSAQSKAQAPQLLNYQGEARDANGNVLKSQNISLRFSILDNNGVEYEETQSDTTNMFGLFTVAIGGGTSLYGNPFSSLHWTDSAKFLEVDMDTNLWRIV
jgi:hypothetical protein